MKDARTVDLISKMHEVDPVFADVVDVLFGGAVDAREAFDISKMNDSSEMHVKGALRPVKRRRKQDEPRAVAKREMTERQRQKRQAQVGLASNVLGLGAGADALRQALKDPNLRTKVGGNLPAKGSVVLSRKGKLMAIGSLGLQTTNVVGDVVANRVLSREANKKVSKAMDDLVQARRRGEISSDTAMRIAEQLTADIEKGMLGFGSKRAAAGTLKALQSKQPHFTRVAAGMAGGTGAAAGFAAGRKTARPPVVNTEVAKPVPPPKPPKVERVGKADDVEYVFAGEISKRDDDKRLAFGWCNLSTVGGEPVVDLQGDYAPIEEIEKSAYRYVVESRKGGDMHQRVGDGPLHTADLVESFVVTPDKLAELGVPADVAKGMNTGWWVGFRVNDDEQWQKVKSGERAGFSVHGSGRRVEKAVGGSQ